MKVFEIRFSDGQRFVRTYLNARDIVFAAMKADWWAEGSRWHRVGARALPS